jgi:DNA-binding NarL/FixJ family response regulator
VTAVRVVVVDDHPMWRDGVSRDLTEAGFDVAKATRPDVVVMDLQLPLVSGVEATRAIVESVDGVRVLVLSASGEQADVLDAVKAGATGYLVKSASAADLVDAVRRTAAGDPVFTPGLAGLVLGEFRQMPAGEPRTRLTERETEVLRLVAKGLTYKQIAERLVLSHRTVQNHVQNVLGKLRLHTRYELVRYAVKEGLDDG